jgi:triacylglycerol esterase/lipase EstA (alpha/beta hydrolase family)
MSFEEDMDVRAKKVAESYTRRKGKPSLPDQSTSNEVLARAKLKSEIIDELVKYYNNIPNMPKNSDKLQSILDIIKIVLNK